MIGLRTVFAALGLALAPARATELVPVELKPTTGQPGRTQGTFSGFTTYTPPCDGFLYVSTTDADDTRRLVVFDAGGAQIGVSPAVEGRTPCVVVEMDRSQELSISVFAPNAGTAELRLATAVETEATEAATEALTGAAAEADQLYADGARSEAVQLLEAVLDEVQTTPGAEASRALGLARWDAARTLRLWGSLRVSRRAFEWTLPHFAERLPSDHSNLIDIQDELASTCFEDGQLARAHDLYERLLEFRSTHFPPDSREVLVTRYNLGATKFRLNDLNSARQLHESILEALAGKVPDDEPLRMHTMQNLAATLEDLGDLVAARELLNEVLEVRSRTLPADHPDLLDSKNGLAVILRRLGDLESARALNDEVLEVRSRILPPDHPRLLGTLQNQALTLRALGDLEGALENEEHVLRARSARLEPHHPEVLAAQQNIALTKLSLGDLQGARALQEAVLEIRATRLDPSNPVMLDSMDSLAATEAKIGNYKRAGQLLEQVLVGMQTRSRRLRMDSPRAARELAAHELRRFAVVLYHADAARASGALAAEFCNTLASLRDVSIGSSDVALALADHPELRELHGSIADLKKALNDHSASIPDERAAFETWSRELSRIASERDRQEKRLRSALGEAGVFVSAIDVQSVASGLSKNAVAISYLKYARGSEDTGRERVEPVDSLLAFLIEPSGEVTLVPLGPSAPIESLLVEWRRAVGKPIAGGDEPQAKPSEERAGELGAQLTAKLLDPILAGVPEAAVLHIVPDDFLYLVPFDALPHEDELLGERFTLHTHVALARLVPRAPRSHASERLVLFGGVDYEAENAADSRLAARAESGLPEGLLRGGVPTGGFRYLPGTRTEVDSLADLYGSVMEVEPRQLTGPEATKAALHRYAPGSRFLHIATHGWFAPQTAFANPDSTPGASGPESWRLLGFAPATLCGLALAGSNLGPDATGRVPGILTAEELAGIDLRTCELAVLSGCATSIGVRRAGQGLQSLQTALHAAGVESAVTSLWAVDDRWTTKLMEEFYRRVWRDGQPKATALWEAKMALREQNVPVGEWAGWVLTGSR